MGDFDAALDALEMERKNPGYLKKAHERAIKRWWEALEGADRGGGSDEWMSPGYGDLNWKLAKVPATCQTDDPAYAQRVETLSRSLRTRIEQSGDPLDPNEFV